MTVVNKTKFLKKPGKFESDPLCAPKGVYKRPEKIAKFSALVRRLLGRPREMLLSASESQEKVIGNHFLKGHLFRRKYPPERPVQMICLKKFGMDLPSANAGFLIQHVLT